MKDDSYNPHRQRGRSLTRLTGGEYQQRFRHQSLDSRPAGYPIFQTPVHSGAVGALGAHPPEKYRGGFRQRRILKQGGLFQSVFTSFVACNELLYDRCDECGDDGISYTYGNVSKNSITTATEEDEDSNTLEESTLDNSTILSDTLHADWETIATGPIYRDLDEAKSDIVHGAISEEKDWYRMYHTGDVAPRDISPPGNMINHGQYTLSTSPGQVRHSDHTGNKDRTTSAKESISKEEYYIDNALSRSKFVSDNDREQKHSSSPLRCRSKSGDRTAIIRSWSRSLTRQRSLTRRPNQKRAQVQIRSAPRHVVRGRSKSRKKRSISSSKLPLPALKIGPCMESNQRRGLSSSSKESYTSIGKERSKQPANNGSDKLSRSSRSRAARSRKSAGAFQSRATRRSAPRSSKLNLQKETEKSPVMNRLRGCSPGRRGKSECMRFCDSVRNDDTTARQRSATAERLSELFKPEKKSEFTSYSQVSLVATKVMDRKSRSLMNTSLPMKQNRELKLQTGGNTNFVKGVFFSWRKIKGSSYERHTIKTQEGQSTQNLVQMFHIPAPSVSEDAPAPYVDEIKTSGLAFPVPHEEGQEIAIEDNEHCYEDPANVHSMLTMPSLDLHILDEEEANIDRENDRNLIVVLTGNEDGTLVTDDCAL